MLRSIKRSRSFRTLQHVIDSNLSTRSFPLSLIEILENVLQHIAWVIRLLEATSSVSQPAGPAWTQRRIISLLPGLIFVVTVHTTSPAE